MWFTDIPTSPLAWLIIVVVIIAIWMAKEGGGQIRFGCLLIAGVFLFFTVKTCRELDEEEALEQKREEEIHKRIEEEKKMLEERKRERQKEVLFYQQNR